MDLAIQLPEEMSPRPKVIDRPEIYRYLSYRGYLKDLAAYFRSQKMFSVRQFAVKSGLKSTGHLSMIISGKRNISQAIAIKIASAFELDKKESEFFFALVDFDQAETTRHQTDAYRELLKFKAFREFHHVSEAQLNFFSKWYHVVLLEMLSHPESTAQNIEALSEALKIKPSEVENSLKKMVELGLIEKGDKGWRRVASGIESPKQMMNLNILELHREMIQKSLEALEAVSPDDRELGSLTISLSKESFEDLRARIFQFQRELHGLYSDESNAEKVFQMNIQLFPLATLPKLKKSDAS